MAKKPITIPAGVTVTYDNGKVVVSGPKGQLESHLPENVKLEIANGEVKIVCELSPLAGTTAANLNNSIAGVTKGWSRVLELSGTGYRANVSGKTLNLSLGFSHPVAVNAPEGISFEVKEAKISVLGNDKVLVGQIAAKIRALRPADPYKAKGFIYENEVIIRKAGKAAKAGGPAGK